MKQELKNIKRVIYNDSELPNKARIWVLSMVYLEFQDPHLIYILKCVCLIIYIYVYEFFYLN